MASDGKQLLTRPRCSCMAVHVRRKVRIICILTVENLVPTDWPDCAMVAEAGVESGEARYASICRQISWTVFSAEHLTAIQAETSAMSCQSTVCLNRCPGRVGAAPAERAAAAATVVVAGTVGAAPAGRARIVKPGSARTSSFVAHLCRPSKINTHAVTKLLSRPRSLGPEFFS